MIKKLLVLSLWVSGCALGPKDISLEHRRAQFQNTRLNTQHPVDVVWNSYGVPRVTTQTDADLFYTVGVLQMHLRRSQLEFLRMISQGRVSEMLGGSTKNIDYFLRALNFPKIAQRNWEHLSEETKNTLEQMARGMNDYVEQNPQRAIDLKLSGIAPSPWTASDLATIHKFISIDVNWIMFAQVLNFAERPYYQKLWDSWRGEDSFIQLLLQDLSNAAVAPSKLLGSDAVRGLSNSLGSDAVNSSQSLDFKNKTQVTQSGVDQDRLLLQTLTEAYTRSGSNAFAVGKSKTGDSAILSNDPHLGIMIPNMWLFMVLESPSFKTMGFMMPTFPLPAVGRNSHIAWGGTNMWGISSHLSEVSEDDLKTATHREEHIKVRWGRDQKVTLREVKGLPIVTDVPLFFYSKPLSLYWVGMEDSDEVLSFLKINRAANWKEFEQAFVTYAASGQNFVYADKKGNVGRLSAFRQLQLEQEFKIPLPEPIKHKTFKNVTSLPQVYNPSSGFVVSANEALKHQGLLPISLFHAPNDRVSRMTQMLSQTPKVNLSQVRDVQLDTFSQSATDLKEVLLKVLQDQEEAVLLHPVYKALKGWDGHYEQESQGALVFEVLSARLMEAYWDKIKKHLQDSPEAEKGFYQFYTRSTRWREDLGKALVQDQEFVKDQAWLTHLNVAQVRLHEYQNWGNFHPLTLAHPMSRVPLIGKKFKFYEGPYSGGNETLMKSAHPLSATKAPVSYGAQARWMTDLSSEDENYFIFLGGQDGWLSSPNTNDQTPLWLRGEYLQIPFDKEAFLRSGVRSDFGS